jgi:xylulokinase
MNETAPSAAPRALSPTLSLGFDLGSSFIKGSLLDLESGRTLAAASAPDREMAIDSPQPGWAEQDPETWWAHLVELTRTLVARAGVDPGRIGAIGISYQMHGLVCVDRQQRVLRPAIIWCDSRAVAIGQEAFDQLGHQRCLGSLLNSPGNFTAAKLAWVRRHQPELFRRIHQVMLPGDFIAMKLTGEAATTVSGLSEGTFWDFQEGAVSSALLACFDLDPALLPRTVPTFGVQGTVTREAAAALGLAPGIPVCYRAGDQPNNAFSLGVLEPGEVAATAGTSGVVYGISDRIVSDPASRVNLFAHVNHGDRGPRLGVLLCVNGTGILYSWLRRNVAGNLDYPAMNERAAAVGGADGLRCYPFGNGAERMLGNRSTGGCLTGLDFNRHTADHVLRAGLEGIAFSLNYGMDIMRGMGMELGTIRAGNANLFLSPLFRRTLADLSGAVIQLFDTDGAAGAARGAALGAGLASSPAEALRSLRKLGEIHPEPGAAAAVAADYAAWRQGLDRMLNP